MYTRLQNAPCPSAIWKKDFNPCPFRISASSVLRIKRIAQSMSKPLPFGRAIIHRATGRIMGPIVPIFAEDWPFVQVPPKEMLWRYLDYSKFEDLVSTSTLYFSRPDRFKDPFEGRLTHADRKVVSESDRVFRQSYRIVDEDATRSAQHDMHRQVVFISCWHRNTHDTREMWDAYTESSDSVVVSTTVNSLLRHMPSSIMQYGVTYMSTDKPRTEFSHNSLFFYKPTEYSFEREYRMLRTPETEETFDPENPADTHRRVPIPFLKVIHRIVIHPAASIKTQAKVHAILRKFYPARQATVSKTKKRAKIAVHLSVRQQLD